MENVTVVVAGDEGVAPGLFATIGSVAVSCNKGRRLDVHCLDTGLLDGTRQTLAQYVGQFGNVGLVMHSVDLSPFKDATPMRGGYSSYARILFRRYVKSKRILYLDADFLVMKDVSVLFDMDMEGYSACATMTPTIPYLKQDCPFFAPEEVEGIPYFNAGILLVDAEKWDRESCERRIIEKLKMGKKLRYHDQTLLNYVFRGRWKRLDNSWGLMMIHNTDNPLNTNYHFGGGRKPWQFGATFISTGLWWVFYEVRIQKYFPLANAKLLKQRFSRNERLVYYCLPLVSWILCVIPYLRGKVLRMCERRKYYKIFRDAEVQARNLWGTSA